MYNSEGFLQYAKEFLKAHVSEETIREVRDVSMERSSTILRRQKSAARAERAVLNWLLTEYSVVDQSADFPDFIARKGDLKFGFEVKYLRDIRSINSLIIENVYRAIVELNTDFFEEINIIIVVDDVDIIEKSKVFIKNHIVPQILRQVKIIFGIVDQARDDCIFLPLENISQDDSGSANARYE